MQPDERPLVAPPHTRGTLDQAFVLGRLRKAGEARQLIAHAATLTPTSRPSRIGTITHTSRGSSAARRVDAPTPPGSGEGAAGSHPAARRDGFSKKRRAPRPRSGNGRPEEA